MKKRLIKIIFTILISINFVYGRNIEKKISGINFKEGEIGKFIIVGKLKTARMGHTATLLDDGTVLIAGGQTIKANKEHKFDFRTKTAEIYDPKTGEFTEIPGLKYAREKHVAIKLDNGKVLFFGGIMDVSFGYKRPKEEYVEEYDPETREFRVVGELQSKIVGYLNYFKGIKMDNGKIFLYRTSGWESKSYMYPEIYDPQKNKSEYTKKSLRYTRSDNGLLKLKDGKIILIGGNVYLPLEERGKSVTTFKDEKCDLSVEIYDPETEEIELRYPLLEKRNRTNAILLNEDKILICGGISSGGYYKAIKEGRNIEVYDIKNNKTEIVGKLDSGLNGMEAVMIKLNDRYSMITGELNLREVKKTEKIYDIKENKILRIKKMQKGRVGYSLTKLSDGNILIIGGGTRLAEIFVINKDIA